MSELTDRQREYIKGAKWSMDMHLNCEDKGVLMYSCKPLGIYKTVVTPKAKGQWGTGKATFTRDGDETEYESLVAMLNVIVPEGENP